jgi:hypothetical protein
MKNKETLEEVAKKQWGNVHRTGVLGFINGAKWQAERMYSEEEVFNILMDFSRQEKTSSSGTPHSVAKWFEQFKKK